MLIRVRYADGSTGVVDDSSLDRLIEEGRICSFLRSSGWVEIGEDPLRRCSTDRRGRGRMVNIYV